MASNKPLIAFFGATGGCCAAALTHALNAGHPCTTLARTPSKLRELLLFKGVAESTILTHLKVTQGDVRDVNAVQRALRPNDQIASIIVSGIGINLDEAGFTAIVKQITICREAASTIVAALKALNPPQKPLITIISTTGITAGPRDVPLLCYPFYKSILHNAHIDKLGMEQTFATEVEAGTNGKSDACIRGFVTVRPSLLTSGPGERYPVKVGTEPKPAIGYTISRDDVGKWIFDEIVNNKQRDHWLGEKVTLTY